MNKFPGKIIKGTKGQVLLTPEQEVWFRQEYPVNKNKESTQTLGICYENLRQMAKSRGLEKKKSFMKALLRESMAAAHAKLLEIGHYEKFRQPGAMAKAWAARDAYYASGHSPVGDLTPREKEAYRREHSKKMTALFRRDKMRRELGLSPLTKRKFVSRQFTRQEIYIRYYAINRYNYLLPDPTPREGKERYTIYYDQDTQRSARFEANSTKKGFTFLPA